jgi:hypothetical protein
MTEQGDEDETDNGGVAAAVSGLLHTDTQVHDDGVDLTVGQVYVVDGPGRVDFGGGELATAATSPHGTSRRNPGDDHGWWHLDAGRYLIEYNESLSGNDEFLLQARRAVLERGASHPTRVVASLPRMPLSVGGDGVRLKENARVSTLRADTTRLER